LQGEASPSVVKACETIVRAHEVCVVTLNTEYQVRLRSFPYLYSPPLFFFFFFYQSLLMWVD